MEVVKVGEGVDVYALVGDAVMVGEPVDVYAMVGISVDLVNRRSENTRSENTRGAMFMHKYSVPVSMVYITICFHIYKLSRCEISYPFVNGKSLGNFVLLL